MGNGMGVGKIVGGSGIISHSVRERIEKSITPNDEILFCLAGNFQQAIVALENRLLVISPGSKCADTTGTMATSFFYKDITKIELSTGPLQSVIQISVAGDRARRKKGQRPESAERDPVELSNCVPINKADLNDYQAYLEKLRALIANAKQTEVISELEALAVLYQSGTLADGEFEMPKKNPGPL